MVILRNESPNFMILRALFKLIRNKTVFQRTTLVKIHSFAVQQITNKIFLVRKMYFYTPAIKRRSNECAHKKIDRNKCSHSWHILHLQAL